MSFHHPRYEQRLNAIRFATADPAQALAASALVVALADARDREYPARRTEALEWLGEGAGRRWAECLGADELLADVLADI